MSTSPQTGSHASDAATRAGRDRGPENSRPAVAIVGCGPKGLFALEALLSELREVPVPIDLHLFEPHQFPGSGPVYDPRLPSHLRMNYENRNIDAWRRRDGLPGSLDFCGWLERFHPERAAPHEFAPRALVGAYLHHTFLQLVRGLPDCAHLHFHRRRVTKLVPMVSEGTVERLKAEHRDDVLGARAEISRVMRADRIRRFRMQPPGDQRWRIESEPSGRAPSVVVDQVLLTIGHSAGRPVPWEIPKLKSRAARSLSGAVQRPNPAATARAGDATGEGLPNRVVRSVFAGVDRPQPAASSTAGSNQDSPPTLEQIPAGSSVAIRGFALTWIDATLSLFEGRGGSFEPNGNAGQLRYVPSGREVRRVFPMSRTGSPLLAKPFTMAGPIADRLNRLWKNSRERLGFLASAFRQKSAVERGGAPDVPRREVVDSPLALHPAVGLLLEEITDAAALAVQIAEPVHRTEQPEELRRRLGDWVLRRAFAPIAKDPGAVIREMQLSLAVAHRAHPLGGSWALGEAWRALYPTIVDVVGHGGLPEEAWPDFRSLHAAMERLAFGPPATNMARILALIEGGWVDLSALHAPDVAPKGAGFEVIPRPTRASESRESLDVDYLVDAVIARPGADRSEGTILGGLLKDGFVSIQGGTEGVRVAADGGCLDADGSRVPGLSVLGRATEGCVLGNDSLSRTLHQHPERWARSVHRVLESRSRPDSKALQNDDDSNDFLQSLPAALLMA